MKKYFEGDYSTGVIGVFGSMYAGAWGVADLLRNCLKEKGSSIQICEVNRMWVIEPFFKEIENIKGVVLGMAFKSYDEDENTSLVSIDEEDPELFYFIHQTCKQRNIPIIQESNGAFLQGETRILKWFKENRF